jgi:hypothetical protein
MDDWERDNPRLTPLTRPGFHFAAAGNRGVKVGIIISEGTQNEPI